MAGRRGSASATPAAAVICLLVLGLHCVQVAEGTLFVVGAALGWTGHHIAEWAKDKVFKAGDTLLFNYKQGAHNVVALNKTVFGGCGKFDANKGTVYHSGKDEVKLVKGENIFVCGYPGQCEAGMNLQITAS